MARTRAQLKRTSSSLSVDNDNSSDANANANANSNTEKSKSKSKPKPKTKSKRSNRSGSSTPARASNSSTPRKTDPDQTWVFLQDGVESIMTRLREGMSSDRYMALYTSLYDYCTDTRMGTGVSDPLPLGATAGGANLRGGELYTKLKQYLEEHLKRLAEPTNKLADEPLLQYYTDQWERYTSGALYVHKLFHYLNRHWVKREKEEGKRNVYLIYTLALVQWRDCFFMSVQKDQKLTKALLNVIGKHRDGEIIETKLIKKVVDSFVALGVDDTDSNRQLLDLYRTYFENPFLEATREYYRRESETFVGQNTVTDYMKKAEKRLQQEEEFVDMHLHSASKKALISTCEDALISAHSELLQQEFQRLLDSEMEADLLRMYSLLNRIPNGLDPLRDGFEKYVKKCGLDAIEKIVPAGDAEEVEPKQYVDSLLAVHRRSTELVQSAFNGDVGFNTALDKACGSYVNANKATGGSAQKSPELIARFVDSILKKSNKTSEETDLESTINEVMTIFKYITEKDVFQSFYSKHLAKRLIQGTSSSDDAEESTISKLKAACGYDYTTKFTRMFQDMRLNKDLNDSFKQYVDNLDPEDRKNYVDFSVSILSAGSWPLSAPSTKLIIPKDLAKTFDRFCEFYKEKHTNRRLSWLWQLSKNELRTTYAQQPYTFMTSTYQAAVLLQFNGESDRLAYSDLKTCTELDDNILKAVLGQLEKAKILIRDGDIYDLNLKFRAKKIRVNLNAPIKAEAKAEQNEIQTQVLDLRQDIVQSTIVRIMKARKQLRHKALIQETAGEVKGKFTPHVSDIKKQIDHLLDQDYMCRDESDKDLLNYVA